MTTPSVSAVNTAAGAAADAIATGDWATAVAQLGKALALLNVIPDSMLGGGGSGASQLTYDRPALQALLADARRQQTAAAVNTAGGFRFTKQTYKRPTDTANC